MNEPVRVIPFERLRMTDVQRVGGKNASLGEMIANLGQAGIRVPGGFATTADAFREFLAFEGLAARIETRLSTLDVEDVSALTAAGEAIRGWVLEAPLPPGLQRDVAAAYEALVGADRTASLAVRSSATAEDPPQ